MVEYLTSKREALSKKKRNKKKEHSSRINNNQEVETAQCPQMDIWTHIVGSIHTGAALSHKQDDALTHATMCKDLKDIMLHEKNRYKSSTMCGAIGRKHPEWKNPEAEVDLWVLGAGERTK
jgi:hypothetical protein